MADVAEWTRRRIAWGLPAEEAAEWDALDPDDLIERLLAPGSVAPTDPLTGGSVVDVSVDWILSRSASRDHLRTAMELCWIDWFGVAGSLVRPPGLISRHLDLLRAHALGTYRQLLTDVCTDPAMMRLLNADLNRRGRPNQNLARELLELYTVGVGNFGERDVEAASASLSGWVIDDLRGEAAVRHDAERHDDRRRRLLGVDGVHDLASVLGVALAHPTTPARVSAGLARRLLGMTALDEQLLASFDVDRDVTEWLERVLRHRVAEAAPARLMGAVPWLVQALRVTGAAADREAIWSYLVACGTAPADPIPLEGFPEPVTLLEPVPLLARGVMARHVAERSTSGLEALPLEELARAIGITSFAPASSSRIEALAGVDRLAAALLAPEVCLV